MNRRGIRVFLVCLLVAVVARPIASQAPPPETVERPEARAALDAIRQDLARKRFQVALASLKKLLADPALAEGERAEALDARARAHVGRGELSAAEKDYRELLALRPELVWDESMGPAKARSRFEKSRKAVVGTVRLSVSPEDAVVRIDDREPRTAPDGTIPLAAGTHRVTGTRTGYDPFETSVEVAADRESVVEVRLSANSQVVVVRTEMEDVAVFLDGAEVGRTARSAAGEPELRLEDVPVGQHTFELRKPCYRTEVLEPILTVDLLARAPAILGPVSLEPLRGFVLLRGVPREWEVALNGKIVDRNPEDRSGVCPGPFAIEVRAGGRAIWRQEGEIEADEETGFDVVPRPNLAVVGGAQAPDAFRTSFSVRDVPASGGDLARTDGWQGVALPPDTDLALGTAGGTVLYSPILGIVTRVDERTAVPPRPVWHATTIGVHLADSLAGGACRVIEVSANGPAARSGILPGDRIVRVAGDAVTSARQAIDRIAAERAGAPFPVEVVRGGASRTFACTGADTLLLEPAADPFASSIRAAWAAVDAVALPEGESPVAWANLGLLLGRSGRHAEAAAAWRRVTWPERAGIGAGTAAYYLGIEKAAIGEHGEAREALRKAAASAATTFRDDGPEVAPAARSHLADEEPTAR